MGIREEMALRERGRPHAKALKEIMVVRFKFKVRNGASQERDETGKGQTVRRGSTGLALCARRGRELLEVLSRWDGTWCPSGGWRTYVSRGGGRSRQPSGEATGSSWDVGVAWGGARVRGGQTGIHSEDQAKAGYWQTG